jgi:hypothetical protein
MSFLALDIPERHADRAAWLERQLVGLRLAELIASLEACHPPVGARPPLAEVLGANAETVLTRGLWPLPAEKLQQLLAHPRLLLELQERVLRDGSEHWRRLPLTPEHQQLVDETFVQVQHQMTAVEAVAAAPPSQMTGGGVAARRMPWRQMLSIAALLLVAFAGWWRFAAGPPGAASGWGWERPGALAFDGSAPEYLEHLASAAEEWFRKRPETAAELRRRLEEFRRGCDALLAAPHTPLAEGDREWLRERCRAWRDKIDGHLAALEAGGAVPAVRDEADTTVRNLLKALRDRAATVPAGGDVRSAARV